MSDVAQPIPAKSKVPVLIGITFSVIFVLGVAAVFSWTVFVKRSDHAFVRKASTVLPIPAGKVGNRTVWYSDFLKSRDTLKKFLESPAAKEQQLGVNFDLNLERNVLEKLLFEIAVEELAEKRKVEIADNELRAFFADVVNAASSTTPDVGVYLLENFGWNEEDFRQKVLKPALLEQRLALLLAQEKQGDQNALAAYLDERLKQKDVVRFLRF